MSSRYLERYVSCCLFRKTKTCSTKHKLLVWLDINRSALGNSLARETNRIFRTIDSEQILIGAAHRLNRYSNRAMADGTVALNHDVGRRLRVEHTNGVGTQMQHMKLICIALN